MLEEQIFILNTNLYYFAWSCIKDLMIQFLTNQRQEHYISFYLL